MSRTSTTPNNNFTSNTTPTVTDDASKGYSVGSQWINLSTDTVYELTDSTNGAAVWVVLGNVGTLGDVNGPASATDNAITRFNGTTGKLIQNSTVIINDNGALGVGATPTGSFDVNALVYNPGTVSVTGTTVTGTSTEFTKTFKTGDSITTTTSSGSETKEIATITSNTVMATVSAFAGTSTNTTYTSSNTGSQFVIYPNGAIRPFGSPGSTTSAVNDWINKSNTVDITGSQQICAFRDETKINQTVGVTGNVNTFVCLTRINATGTGTFGAVRGFNSAPTVLATNTGNITTIAPLLSATQIQAGATGTITNSIGVLVNPTNSSTTNTVTNQYGVQIAPTQNGGTLTNYAGAAIAAKPTAATNSALLLLNTTTIPSGTWGIYNTSTAANYHAGNETIQAATAIPAGGTAGAGYMFSSTANFGVFFGSGVPSLSAAKGSLYLRSDGSATNNRMYVNTDGGTTWTAVTTAA